MVNTELALKVAELPIRLGQFLKLASLVQDGFEARILVQNEEVMVNGIIETRRGRKLRHGDRVTVNNQTWAVEQGEGLSL